LHPHGIEEEAQPTGPVTLRGYRQQTGIVLIAQRFEPGRDIQQRRGQQTPFDEQQADQQLSGTAGRG